LQSTDEAEREHLLAELLLVRATPLIKHTLWLRLGFRLGKDGENSNNPDAEDIYHEVIAKLVQRLNTLRMEREPSAKRREITLNMCDGLGLSGGLP
jgi:DNA-directed RNA polymerase specialized sigma24 family protein